MGTFTKLTSRSSSFIPIFTWLGKPILPEDILIISIIISSFKSIEESSFDWTDIDPSVSPAFIVIVFISLFVLLITEKSSFIVADPVISIWTSISTVASEDNETLTSVEPPFSLISALTLLIVTMGSVVCENGEKTIGKSKKSNNGIVFFIFNF